MGAKLKKNKKGLRLNASKESVDMEKLEMAARQFDESLQRQINSKYQREQLEKRVEGARKLTNGHYTWTDSYPKICWPVPLKEAEKYDNSRAEELYRKTLLESQRIKTIGG